MTTKLEKEYILNIVRLLLVQNKDAYVKPDGKMNYDALIDTLTDDFKKPIPKQSLQDWMHEEEFTKAGTYDENKQQLDTLQHHALEFDYLLRTAKTAQDRKIYLNCLVTAQDAIMRCKATLKVFEVKEPIVYKITFGSADVLNTPEAQIANGKAMQFNKERGIHQYDRNKWCKGLAVGTKTDAEYVSDCAKGDEMIQRGKELEEQQELAKKKDEKKDESNAV